jgi:hypothetical protein
LRGGDKRLYLFVRGAEIPKLLTLNLGHDKAFMPVRRPPAAEIRLDFSRRNLNPKN